MDHIILIEGVLRGFVAAEQLGEQHWLLNIKLHYDGESAGSVSFNLNGYTNDELNQLIRDIPKNEFIMREIDEYLWGESD